MLFINKHISISQTNVEINGEEIFQRTAGTSASAYFKEIYKHLELKYMKYFKMDMLSKLGLLASQMLVNNTGLAEKYRAEAIAVVIGNSSSSIDIDRKFYATVLDENDIPAPAQFVYTLPNILIGEICIKHGFKGETALLVSEKFDALQLEEYINNMFLFNKKIEAVVCGEVDYFDQSKFNANLFLVEKIDNKENSINFDSNNLLKLYKS